MPREQGRARSSARQNSNHLSPAKSAMRQPLRTMPLNDDREEKAVRFQSRQALQEMHMNSIKAAASPMRLRRSFGSGDPADPHTPLNNDKENENDLLGVVAGNAVTPMKRVPILANFEEWMKMATDNKINAANSWNFALIDYFHDMSLLREGDSVNFQKASCTLDGCVKIYTSRVDSVATETGKLLSGLADSASSKKGRRGGEDGNDGDSDAEREGEDEEVGEDGEVRRVKKRKQRSSEATLASSFAQLQLKKMDLEFSVDPLFKKASADFDEGGAKGLLLNHLTLDTEGRIVFDSSDDKNDTGSSLELDQDAEDTAADAKDAGDASSVPQSLPSLGHAVLINIDALASKFMPDLSQLDEQEVCPSLRTFELGGDSTAIDIPFLNAADESKSHANVDGNGSASPQGDFMEDADEAEFAAGGFDLMADVGFGEGGEAWARDAAINAQPNTYTMTDEADAHGGSDIGEDDDRYNVLHNGEKTFGIHMQHQVDEHANILTYFDQALSKNWAGPEHWRIRKIKDSSRAQNVPRQRRERESFEMDFTAPLSKTIADKIFTTAVSNSAICLPKAQWKSRSRNLLPDDKHFNSKDLLSLFLKPKARLGPRNLTSRKHAQSGEMDGAFWAQRTEDLAGPSQEEGATGTYNADFFQDDGLGIAGPSDDEEDVFADAQEQLGADAVDRIAPGELADANFREDAVDGGYGAQLVTQSRRLRPEYVQYAKVAKKVDIRRLKEEMWKGMQTTNSMMAKRLDNPKADSNVDCIPDASAEASQEEAGLKFTSVINDLQTVYPKQAMADISTSYCFICLLHLANEKGLVLDQADNFEEISIRKDETIENLEPS